MHRFVHDFSLKAVVGQGSAFRAGFSLSAFFARGARRSSFDMMVGDNGHGCKLRNRFAACRIVSEKNG
jgi:hypothetical protein